MIATRSTRSRRSTEGCPFCLGNGMIPPEKIMARTPWAYLVVEYSQMVPGTYQIVPKWHKMNALQTVVYALSLLWLIRKAPPSRVDFNLSFNFGTGAGQTVPHVHAWLIPRVGQYAGRGLAYYVANSR